MTPHCLLQQPRAAAGLVRWVAPLVLLATSACSHVRHTYRAQGYNPLAPEAIKRVAVVGWAPQEAAGAGPVAAQVAADLLKLRKNYLVTGASAGYAGRWSMACDNGVQGVALVRVLRADAAGTDRREMAVALALLRCSDGALLHRSEAAARLRSDDPALRGLVANYATTMGADAQLYAAPSFALLQQLVAQLPDPQLSAEEVDEKIELGCKDMSPAVPKSPHASLWPARRAQPAGLPAAARANRSV